MMGYYHFTVIANSFQTEKYLKKQAKRDKIEKHAAEMKRVQDLLHLQGLLDSLGTDSVREDFTAGTNGATQLSETHLEQLDKLYKLVSPSREDETRRVLAYSGKSFELN